MKKLIFIIILVIVSGCSSYAVRIGNPPALPDVGDNNNDDDNDDNNNNDDDGNNNDDDNDDDRIFSKDIFIKHPNWIGSTIVLNNFTAYLATFTSENVTLQSTDINETMIADYEISLDGDVYTVNEDEDLVISGKIKAKENGYEITLSLYKENQLITTLYKVIENDENHATDILDPYAACLKSENKCFSTDSFFGPLASYYTGQVVSDLSGGDSCKDTFTDYCVADNELVQYSCASGSDGKIMETHFKCDCKDGRCLDMPEYLNSHINYNLAEKKEGEVSKPVEVDPLGKDKLDIDIDPIF